MNARDRSGAGAEGLMQIMPETQRGLGVTDPYDPIQSIWGGAKYLDEALNRETNVEDALRYYHGGPNWRNRYGKESRDYVPFVTARYRTVMASGGIGAGDAGPAPAATPATGAAPVATASKPATKPDPLDDFLTGKADTHPGLDAPAPAAPATAAPARLDDTDRFLTGAGSPDPAAGRDKAPPPGTTTPTGIARAVAAGLTDVGANVGNFLADPVGSVGKLAVTGGVFAHDLIAPLLGGQRFTDAQRHSLLDDEVEQPGTRAVNALGRAMDAPQFVPNSEAERLTRVGVGGAGTLLALGPGGVVAPAVVGAAGAVGGDVAASYAPEWARPAAELAGNVLAGGGTAVAGVGARAVARGSNNALQGFLRGADTPGAVLDPFSATARGRAAPPANQNAAPGAEPVPRSAGAAAAEGDTSVPAAEDLAHRSVAERAKLNEPQPVGPDRTIHIPGVVPTTAEVEQSVNIAREQKALGIRNTEVSQEAKDVAAANNEKRQAYLLNEIIPSKLQLYRHNKLTEEQIKSDYPAAFEGKRPVGEPAMQAVEDEIRASLTDLRGSENTHLQTYIKPLLARLRDAEGNFKVDPEALYGLREDLNRMRSRHSQSQDKNLLHVQGELGDIIATLDDAIETGAPGYRNYMQNTAANLAKRDAMEILRSHESDFYDAQNRIPYSRVQRVLKDIVEGRDMPTNVTNGYKHLPADIMEKLWALRDDLRRSATAKEMASAAGSDTAQNTWDVVKGLAGGIAGNTVGHMAANAALGPVGSAAFNIGKAALSSMRAGKQAAADRSRGLNLLHPDPATLRPRPSALDPGGP